MPWPDVAIGEEALLCWVVCCCASVGALLAGFTAALQGVKPWGAAACTCNNSNSRHVWSTYINRDSAEHIPVSYEAGVCADMSQGSRSYWILQALQQLLR